MDERSLAGVGTGLVGPDGRLLWADEGLVAAVGRDRSEIIGRPFEEAVAPLIAAGALRMTELTSRGGEAWARLVELGARGAGEAITAFAVDGDGKLVAAAGAPNPRLAPPTPGAGDLDLLGDPRFADVVHRSLAGEPAVEVMLDDEGYSRLDLFPVAGPTGGSGVAGVATFVPAARPAPRRETHLSALLDLARLALAGTEGEPLCQQAVRLLRDALGADVCAVFEADPGAGVLEPVAVSRPVGQAPDGPDERLGGEGSEPGVAAVPIGPEARFGYLAVVAAPERPLGPDDELLVAEAAGLLAMALDRLENERRNRRAALEDPLTRVANRSLILEHLRLALARSRRTGGRVAVLFVDLDRFKAVNDTLGHEAGDRLLVEVASRLQGVLRPSDTLGRFGGDEFVVVCEDIGGPADALSVADRLTASLEQPVTLAAGKVAVHLSVGVALSEPDGLSESGALLAAADAAMYRAKGRRGHSVALHPRRALEEPGGPAEGPATTRPVTRDRPVGRLGDLVARLGALLGQVEEHDRPAGHRPAT